MAVLITASVTEDPDMIFSVDVSHDMDINLVQTRRPCHGDTSMMCVVLVITTDSFNLPEGTFNIFYNHETMNLNHG